MKKKTIETFEPSAALLKKASSIASQYSIVLEPDADGGFVGTCLEMPGVLADGTTADECLKHLHFALETVVATYLHDKKTPPAAQRREKRSEQVNVRFTRAERLILERESARQGFRGLGDMIRTELLRNHLSV